MFPVRLDGRPCSAACAPQLTTLDVDIREVAGERFQVIAFAYDHDMPTYAVKHIDEDGTVTDLTGDGKYAYDAVPIQDELTCLLAEHRCPKCWRVSTQELDGDPCGECADVAAQVGAEIDHVIGVHLAPWVY